MSRRRIISTFVGLGIGGSVFWLWLSRYANELGGATQLELGWLVLGFCILLIAPLVQVYRTALIMGVSGGLLLRPVTVCHGVNAVLPALGDVLEVGWLGKKTSFSYGDVFLRCLVRMSFGLFATVFVVGVASGYPLLMLAGLLLRSIIVLS